MIKVVDVFAGPGGLNEGFSRYRHGLGGQVFEVVGSYEVDATAVETLKIRAAARAVGLTDHVGYRAFMNGRLSVESLLEDAEFKSEIVRAAGHVHQLRLGPGTRDESDELIRGSLDENEPWVLIGGPPCQAYSLAGRSRMGHLEGFMEDERHFLFKEYLHIIEKHRPTVFVMENVKGLLSATHRGTKMFDLIMDDLSCSGAYEIRSLVVDSDTLQPRNFIIRAEDYGVPQRRHRVILLGTLKEAHLGRHIPLAKSPQMTLRQAIGRDLPPLRSRVSPLRDDGVRRWLDAREVGAKLANPVGEEDWVSPPEFEGPTAYTSERPQGLVSEWLRSPGLEVVTKHEPRSHMFTDLVRYSYLASMAHRGEHPTLKEMPRELLPNHKNVASNNTPFVDRFKVQAWSGPSSTIVSHISKDGHHFIHPDPRQVRSLTVREAARLQTFPDDYFFMGNRTQQYHQVGNAVPPYLAFQIAHVVAQLLKL